MTLLFDSHAHLADDAFQPDFNEFVQRTLNRCHAVMTIGCESIADFKANLTISHAHHQIFTAVALHPEHTSGYSDDLWAEIERLVLDDRVRAVGETGLDYHWMTSPKDEQIALFARHIHLARRVGKPLIIHDRDAHRDTLDTLWANQADEVGGVLHAYSGSVEMMQEVVEHGFFIGIGGVVTFKNAKTIKVVAQEVPLSHLLIETDCPYLTPVPYRGKRNEPAYVQHVAEKIAELRGISYDEVVCATFENACRLFQIDPDTLKPH